MMSSLKTDQHLIERMKQSAGKPLTRDELLRQRVSFVYGNLPSDSTITRDMVEERLKKNGGFE